MNITISALLPLLLAGCFWGNDHEGTCGSFSGFVAEKITTCTQPELIDPERDYDLMVASEPMSSSIKREVLECNRIKKISDADSEKVYGECKNAVWQTPCTEIDGKSLQEVVTKMRDEVCQVRFNY